MNAPIIRKIALGPGFLPLAASPTVGNFRFRAPASGAGVLLCDDGATEIQLDRNQEFTLDGVDLSQILVKSTGPGDHMVIIGATRTI
jgi:hypothetical protein